jgi:hypothetical protein
MTPTRTLHPGLASVRWRFVFETCHYLGVAIRTLPSHTGPGRAHVKAALDMIHAASPTRIDILCRYLPGGIVVESTDYALAWFNAELRACMIGARHAADDDAIALACSIVHELCHARLDSYGFGYEAQARLRIEKVCVGREVALVKQLVALGLADPIHVRMAVQRLHRLDDAQFSDETLQNMQRKAVLQRLRNVGPHIPRVLRKALVLHVRRRLRTTRAR